MFLLADLLVLELPLVEQFAFEDTEEPVHLSFLLVLDEPDLSSLLKLLKFDTTDDAVLELVPVLSIFGFVFDELLLLLASVAVSLLVLELSWAKPWLPTLEPVTELEAEKLDRVVASDLAPVAAVLLRLVAPVNEDTV